jgi:hypothetical protein
MKHVHVALVVNVIAAVLGAANMAHASQDNPPPLSAAPNLKGLHDFDLRACDPKTGQWAIWWLDGRTPFGDLDPPVKGRFENGVGTFYSDDTLRGKTVRVRFTWSNITATSAHWEQAFSPDGGKTWEVNWIADFKRLAR